MKVAFGLIGGLIGILILTISFYYLEPLFLFRTIVYQQIGIITVMAISLWVAVRNSGGDLHFFRNRFRLSWNNYLVSWLICQGFLFLFGHYVIIPNEGNVFVFGDNQGEDIHTVSMFLSFSNLFMQTMLGLIFPGAIAAVLASLLIKPAKLN